ncbi:VWA domain-containing protein [Emticicia sp. BO119]|uniref:VWA domain-containing protein n=1 Tax=Emticicia sp. BO119 TaxID=2757768 RepID=UPI0015F0D61B|nr:VWA domain-containing protein [Emticicia sp. BO119]MBA4853348.1 VWA domain-containing protein [Emticicia sp. BO119]
MKSELIFQSSPWFIILCLLAGALYAVVLYQKKANFSVSQNRLLAVIRGVLVAFLAFLLINPLLRSNKSTIEKPTVVFAIDNSTSMTQVGQEKLTQLKEDLQKLKDDIESKGVSVEIKTLEEKEDNKDISGVKFAQKTTDLSGLLANLKNNYEGRNLTDVILVSDGIANSGISPTYGRYNFNIHSIGLGDTTQKKDVKLNAVYTNRIAYLSNKFPIQAEISSYGYQGKSTTVLLKQGGKILDKQIVNFDKATDLKQITFYSAAEQKGMQRYTIEVALSNGEFSTRNNSRDVYIDVVDGKEKILLVALAPHPDIKAIKAIIEKNELYELTVKVIQSDNIGEIGSQPFDALILHQLPDLYGSGGGLVTRLLAQQKPTLFVLGNQSNIASFNGMQQTLSIISQSGRADKVTAKFNSSFNLFNLDGEKLGILEKLPPLLSPFGEYRPSTGSEIILYQRVGSLVTPKPLLIANTTNARKSAVLAGEGIWQWRLEEFALTDKQEVVDEIFMKTLQLISVKDDKRKLRVYPISPEFSIDDKVIFENEAYNDIYERIYNQNIKLEITDEKGTTKSYNYTISQENTRFEITGLGEGVYRYKASTQVLGKSESVDGQFIVRNADLEGLTNTADFNMLRTLAQQNNGKFFIASQLEKLKEHFSTNRSPDKVTSIEEMNEFINLKWIFFVLLFLASIEWVTRKYLGSY